MPQPEAPCPDRVNYGNVVTQKVTAVIELSSRALSFTPWLQWFE